jgi:hypothetical protein
MSSPEMHHSALGREGGEGIVPEGTVNNKYNKWLVSLLPSPKNRTSLSHKQPILEAFKI